MVIPSGDPYYLYREINRINYNIFTSNNSEIRSNNINQNSYFESNIQQKFNDFILMNRRN